MTIYFDRSRRADFEKCPRKRYYGYEINGRGIQPVGTQRSDWALMTGIGVHLGIGLAAAEQELEHSVGEAIKGSEFGLLPPAEDQKELQGRAEQVALIEGIVRCWHLAYYPQFNVEYEVLAVEREEQVELAHGVVMMVRPDMLVRRRSDGALFTWQLKTTKRADEKWAAQWPLDGMTISEVLAVEARLKAEFHEPNYEHRETVSGDEYDARTGVSGVIVQGLVKGDQSEWPKGSGNWTFNSPLIYAWHNQSGKPHPRGEWSARFAWTDDDGSHRLGKGWRKLPVWSDYHGGIAAWLAWLQQNDPAVLSEQIVTLQPILRAPYEINMWQVGVVHSEREIREKRGLVENVVGGLARYFPMHSSSGNCIWPYKCSYFGLCHGNADPDDEQMFKPRELNHPQEVVE